MMFVLLACLLQAPAPVLENEYIGVMRDAVMCPTSERAECGDRVIVALSSIELRSAKSRRKMNRGDIAVFKHGESYKAPSGGSYFEVNIKPSHPPVQSPSKTIPPEKNAILYDGKSFFIFEEKLAVGDTRARHSHSQRVVIQLNRTRLQQWPDGQPEILVDIVPDRAAFNPPVIHTAKNVGDAPLRGIVIEFKPELSSTFPK